MSKGVPFDLAFSMDDVEVLAFVVTMARFDGNEWNWNTMDWVKK